MATLVGGGDHYQAHLLKNVKAYDNSRLLYMYDDKPINAVEMSDTTLSAVTRGMHELTVSGSVAYAFENCVVSAGAKTGSAQVGTDIANGVFVAYAPYENPRSPWPSSSRRAAAARRWPTRRWRSSTPGSAAPRTALP